MIRPTQSFSKPSILGNPDKSLSRENLSDIAIFPPSPDSLTLKTKKTQPSPLVKQPLDVDSLSKNINGHVYIQEGSEIPYCWQYEAASIAT